MTCRNVVAAAVAFACLAVGAVPLAHAADDEILVSDADLAAVGHPELEIHTNFSRGSRQSPGEKVFPPDGQLRVTPELSIGLAAHWDAGLYVDTAWVPGNGAYYGGAKLRVKYADTLALDPGRSVYYGLQLEAYDVNPGVSPDRKGLELKAIVGAEFGDWEATLNGIVQRDLPDADVIEPERAVNGRLLRKLGQDRALGLEHYSSWSSTDPETPLLEIDHVTFLTYQFKARDWSIHLGLGHGWSHSPDRTIVKLVLGVPLPW